ncbi:MAG: 50S ribosomal protein L5 [Firmicutes bacterium]|nr:50S ribosomal protein L5 [Bacillota bacterium]
MDLREKYRQEVVPALIQRFGYKNPMQVPKLVKVNVNMGVGDALEDAKLLDAAVEDMTTITGQRPVVTRAKKSIATFKIRAGAAIGCKVTLRGERMYDFLQKLFNVVLPRVRDFRGVSPNSFDGRGNYSLGVKEQLIFPEIDYDQVAKVRGMDINIVTSAQTDEEAYELLKLLGLPLSEN